METTEKCTTCPLRKKYDTNPTSFAGRFWRWHINWCPGWKNYLKTLNDDDKAKIIAQYNLKNK